MTLMLHIFRKDVRHLYPEILVVLLGTAAFAWAAPVQWRAAVPMVSEAGGLVGFVGPLLRILLPVAWLVLISRLIHDESLVGDRQFWITRPYTWTTLLAAKLLFLLAFLCVPFLLMQMYLLHHAGLRISGALGDLLLYELRLAAVFYLPVLAIATVTSSFARLTLTLLAGLLYVGGVFAAGNGLLNGRMTPPQVPFSCAVVSSAGLAAIVLLQYATRRTRVARLCLAAVPVLVLLVWLLSPARALIDRSYPALPGWAGPHLSVAGQASPPQTAGGPFLKQGNKTFLNIPIALTGVGSGQRVRSMGISIVLDAPGVHWSSPFLENGMDSSDPAPALSFALPDSVFERVRKTPAELHLQIAALLSGTELPVSLAASSPATPAPDGGLCSVSQEGVATNCRYAFRLPAPIDVEAAASGKPCDAGQTSPASQPTILVKTFIGSDNHALAFDFDPVALTPMNLAMPQSTPNRFLPAYLCSGSLVTFTSHREMRRGQILVDLHNVVLGPYAMPQVRSAQR